MSYRVLLADDHDLIRQGLRRAFERAGDFEVVDDVGTAAAAVATATATHVDVVVLDIRLPDGDGLDAARTLRDQQPGLGIVVITMYPGDEILLRALQAGASAFVPKDAPADQVIAAARHAAVSPGSFSADGLAAAMQRRTAPSGPRLSPRETDVLRLLADGLPVARLAKQLYISESTAKTHIANLYDKLGAANRAQALMTAVRMGLLDDSPR